MQRAGVSILLKQFSESEASTLYPPIREEKNKKVNLGTNNKVKKVIQKKSIKKLYYSK